MEKNITDKFIDEIYSLTLVEFSENLYSLAKSRILDYIGVSLAGSKVLSNSIVNYSRFSKPEKGFSKIIGFNKKTTMNNAALLNGMSSHVLELDDGNRFGAIHPGSPIITALFSVAEKEKISGRNILRGVIVGYEVAIRLAKAIQPAHYRNGFHPTSTCGLIGAASCISIALNLPKEEFKNVFSIACTSAFGTLKVLEDDSTIKPYNVGRSAQLAIESLYLVKSGFIGPKDSLGGKNGFLNMMAGGYNTDYLFKKSNKFEIEDIYNKIFSSCRHAHSSIEAALLIKKNNPIVITEIQKINIYIYGGLEGKHDHKVILNSSSAKMSIPYSVIIALITGKAGINEFSEEWIHNVQVQKLLKITDYHINDNFTNNLPYKRSSVVEIINKNNLVYKAQIDLPKGEPEHPLSMEELVDKFIYLSKTVNKTDANIEKIIDIVDSLEYHKFNDLMKIL